MDFIFRESLPYYQLRCVTSIVPNVLKKCFYIKKPTGPFSVTLFGLFSNCLDQTVSIMIVILISNLPKE